MKKMLWISMLVVIMPTLFLPATMAQERTEAGDTLVVLWTSGDIEVAEKLVFMYVTAAKSAGWFDEVVFIIWGPSARLLAETEKLQAGLKKMQELGVRTEACVVCARMYEVDDDLRDLGVDVKGMGRPLSDYMKKKYHVLTF